MPFRPTNRNIKENIPMPYQASLKGCWYVDDIDMHGTPITYRSESCEYRIQQDREGFIICSPHGYYLRHERQKNGRKGRVKRFKTPSLAAAEAESKPEGEWKNWSKR